MYDFPYYDISCEKICELFFFFQITLADFVVLLYHRCTMCFLTEEVSK